jgi:hypothetical protein
LRLAWQGQDPVDDGREEMLLVDDGDDREENDEQGRER